MKKIDYLLSLPKSVFYNIKIFGWVGVRCPILFHYSINISVSKYSECFINGGGKSFGVKIGFDGTEGIIYNSRPCFRMGDNAKIVFSGKAYFGKGSSLRCDSGTLVIGRNFSCNRNCLISCNKSIVIGDDCLLGWNISIRDSDGHRTYENGYAKKDQSEIVIGNHVWIASDVTILKGSVLKDGTIVCSNSLVNKCFDESNVLLAGIPSTIKKRNMSWKL